MSLSRERVGIICALLSAASIGLFPVLVHRAVISIPPLSLIIFTNATALIGALIYSLYKGTSFELLNRQAYKPLIILTICIIIIPSILFYSGTRLTTGVNSSMLLLFEIVFTALISPLWGETTTRNKIIGVLGIFLGGLFILYKPGLRINWGDILIIASTSTYPIGNYFAKKVLEILSPASLLLARLSLGLPVLIVVARYFEPNVQLVAVARSHWLIIDLSTV